MGPYFSHMNQIDIRVLFYLSFERLVNFTFLNYLVFTLVFELNWWIGLNNLRNARVRKRRLVRAFALRKLFDLSYAIHFALSFKRYVDSCWKFGVVF